MPQGFTLITYFPKLNTDIQISCHRKHFLPEFLNLDIQRAVDYLRFLKYHHTKTNLRIFIIFSDQTFCEFYYKSYFSEYRVCADMANWVYVHFHEYQLLIYKSLHLDHKSRHLFNYLIHICWQLQVCHLYQIHLTHRNWHSFAATKVRQSFGKRILLQNEAQ